MISIKYVLTLDCKEKQKRGECEYICKATHSILYIYQVLSLRMCMERRDDGPEYARPLARILELSSLSQWLQDHTLDIAPTPETEWRRGDSGPSRGTLRIRAGVLPPDFNLNSIRETNTIAKCPRTKYCLRTQSIGTVAHAQRELKGRVCFHASLRSNNCQKCLLNFLIFAWLSAKALIYDTTVFGNAEITS